MKSRFLRLNGLESRFNIGNRLVGTQMASQIAGIDILHILGNENTYMKNCSKQALDAESIYTNLTSCLIYNMVIGPILPSIITINWKKKAKPAT